MSNTSSQAVDSRTDQEVDRCSIGGFLISTSMSRRADIDVSAREATKKAGKTYRFGI